MARNQQNIQRNILFFSLLLFVGCSDHTSSPPPQKTSAPPPAPTRPISKPETLTPPSPAAPAPSPAPEATEKVSAPPIEHAIRVTALMKPQEGPVRVGVVQDSTGYWRMLRIGEAFLGYKVVSIDYKNESVQFMYNKSLVVLGLEGRVEQTVVETSVENKPAQAEAKLVRGKTNYAPSIDERQRGIDPNDAATWPADYRGPAIERIALEMQNTAPNLMSPENVPAAQNFIPTADESSRGINPNDSETWPEGYRGPAIERTLQSMETNTNAPAPEFNREPPQGTPEEIKQRFFDTYAPDSETAPETP